VTTLWPVVQAGLVTLLPTLSGWENTTVYDGAPLAGDAPGDDGISSYCAVGYVEDEAGAGSWQQQPEGSGFFDLEAGEVRSGLFVGNGDDDLPAARTAAFALVDALQASMKADRRLGCLPNGATSSLSADVLPVQDSEVTGVLLILSVSYTAPVT
jgi:hypothetical protein